jgi:hypothetical protein
MLFYYNNIPIKVLKEKLLLSKTKDLCTRTLITLAIPGSLSLPGSLMVGWGLATRSDQRVEVACVTS